MALTREERALLRGSFRRLAGNRRRAGERFYGILFDQAPHTRALFVNDPARQGRQFLDRLEAVVTALDSLESLAPLLEDLALRHVAYGVRPEHYPLVGKALRQLLAEELGAEFTPEVEAAWTRAYAELSALMIRHAYSQSLTPGRR